MTQSMVTLALAYASAGWHVFPISKGTTNKPRVKWGTEATTDEKKIKGWWKAWPEDNIGIACGPSGLVVVDLDMKKGKNGRQTLDLLELEHGELPHTRIAVTPSGGFHLYFKGTARTTVEALGPGIDTRAAGGAGGYVLAPGSRTEVGSYEWQESSQIPIVALPDWIAHLAGHRAEREHKDEAVVDQDQAHYVEWAIRHLQLDAKPAIEGKGGNKTTFYLACVLRERGLSQEKARALMLEHYNPRCQPPWSEEELDKIVENAFNYASVVPPGGDTAEHDFGDPDMEDDQGEFGPAPIQGEQAERYAGIMNDWVWIGQAKMFLRRRDRFMFDEKSFNSMFNYMIEGKTGNLSTEIFANKRSMRKFDSFDFLPEQPEFCGPCYNLWVPPNVEATDADPSMFVNHLAYLFEDPYERRMVTSFMAWCVQNPAKKPNFAMVIKGFEGTGKSFLGQALERIFGYENTARPLNTDIQSQFNGWARNAKLVVIEELMVRGRVDLMNHLKPMITDPIISINEKFQPVQKISNHCVLVAFTNHEDALPLSDDDRRYLIATSYASPRETAYYAALFDWLENGGGIGAIKGYLQRFDLQDFDGKGRAPMTKSKVDMREASRTDYDRYWKYLMDSKLPPFHGQLVYEGDLVDALPEAITSRTRGLHGAARKFLVNVAKAKNMGQHRTSVGRVVLWAIRQPTINKGRPARLRSVIYEREMSLEAQNKAREAALGDDWDNADRKSPYANMTEEQLDQLKWDEEAEDQDPIGETGAADVADGGANGGLSDSAEAPDSSTSESAPSTENVVDLGRARRNRPDMTRAAPKSPGATSGTKGQDMATEIERLVDEGFDPLA